jgi:hypothetical protein
MQQLALHFLADCPLVDGEWAEAETRYRQALAFAQRAGLIGRVIDETVGVAMALAGAGESARALRLAGAAHQKRGESGRVDDAWWQGMQDRLLGGARLKVDAEEAASAEDQGRRAGLEAVVSELLAEEPADAS